MTYAPRPARTLLLPLLLAMQACAPFASERPIAAIPSACASLLPDEWLGGVIGAPLPEGDVLADWQVFADAQTGQLDKANDRYRAAIGIVQRCEARDAAAVQAARRRRFLGIF